MIVGFIGFGQVASTLSNILSAKGIQTVTVVKDRSQKTNKLAVNSDVQIIDSYKALLEAGYNKLVIIRTKSDELQGKIPQNDDILVITPSENLGSSIQFTHDNIMEFIKLGYSDTIKIINHVKNYSLFTVHD